MSDGVSQMHAEEAAERRKAKAKVNAEAAKAAISQKIAEKARLMAEANATDTAQSAAEAADKTAGQTCGGAENEDKKHVASAYGDVIIVNFETPLGFNEELPPVQTLKRAALDKLQLIPYPGAHVVFYIAKEDKVSVQYRDPEAPAFDTVIRLYKWDMSCVNSTGWRGMGVMSKCDVLNVKEPKTVYYYDIRGKQRAIKYTHSVELDLKTLTVEPKFEENATLAEAAALPDGAENIKVIGCVKELHYFGKLAHGEIHSATGNLHFSLNKNEIGDVFDKFKRDVRFGDYIGIEGTMITHKGGARGISVKNFISNSELCRQTEPLAYTKRNLTYLTVNFLTDSDGDLPHPHFVRRELDHAHNGIINCKNTPILIRGEFDAKREDDGQEYYYSVYINRDWDSNEWERFGRLRITHQTPDGSPWFYVKPLDGDVIVFRHAAITNTELDLGYDASVGEPQAKAEAEDEDASLNPDGTFKFIKLNFENPIRGKLPPVSLIREELKGRGLFDYAGTKDVLIAQSECDRHAGKTHYHHHVYLNHSGTREWQYYGEIHQRSLLCGGFVKYGIQRKDGELVTMRHHDDVDESVILEHLFARARAGSDRQFGEVKNSSSYDPPTQVNMNFWNPVQGDLPSPSAVRDEIRRSGLSNADKVTIFIAKAFETERQRERYGCKLYVNSPYDSQWFKYGSMIMQGNGKPLIDPVDPRDNLFRSDGMMGEIDTEMFAGHERMNVDGGFTLIENVRPIVRDTQRDPSDWKTTYQGDIDWKHPTYQDEIKALKEQAKTFAEDIWRLKTTKVDAPLDYVSDDETVKRMRSGLDRSFNLRRDLDRALDELKILTKRVEGLENLSAEGMTPCDFQQLVLDELDVFKRVKVSLTDALAKLERRVHDLEIGEAQQTNRVYPYVRGTIC